MRLEEYEGLLLPIIGEPELMSDSAAAFSLLLYSKKYEQQLKDKAMTTKRWFSNGRACYTDYSYYEMLLLGDIFQEELYIENLIAWAQ